MGGPVDLGYPLESRIGGMGGTEVQKKKRGDPQVSVGFNTWSNDTHDIY